MADDYKLLAGRVIHEHNDGDQMWDVEERIIERDGKLYHSIRDGYDGGTLEEEVDKRTAEALIADNRAVEALRKGEYYKDLTHDGLRVKEGMWLSPAGKDAFPEAYISRETRDAAIENPTIDALSKAVLKAAKDVMNLLNRACITTLSTARDGTTYADKMVVKVEPATKWNKETKEQEPLTHKDGSPVYRATAEIKHNGTTLTLTAKEDISDGAKFVAMTASKWDRSPGQKPKLNFYKQDEIANAYINKDIKEIAAHIQEACWIEPNPLKQHNEPKKEPTKAAPKKTDVERD